MTDTEILKGNTLIAEFMGGETDLSGVCKFSDGRIFAPINAKYNSSWDWLMPVVVKIFKTRHKNPMLIQGAIQSGLLNINIDKVYSAVIELIKWYNEEKTWKTITSSK